MQNTDAPDQDGLVAGIDECGMGPIAGPVTVAVVVLPDGIIPGVRDSKKVAEPQRYPLAEAIHAKALFAYIASRTNTDIDERRLDVCWAECVAECRDAVLARFPGIAVLADWADESQTLAEKVAGITFVRNGEDEVYAIAAASLVAKAHRDRHMIDLGRQFPEYDLGKHKGYGTPDHWKALREHGPSPIHRRAASKIKPAKEETAPFDRGNALSLLTEVKDFVGEPWIGDWERRFLSDTQAKLAIGRELTPRQMYYLQNTVRKVRKEAKKRQDAGDS